MFASQQSTGMEAVLWANGSFKYGCDFYISSDSDTEIEDLTMEMSKAVSEQVSRTTPLSCT